ncbi:hypothetical protein NGH41_07515 [Staphylococcus succinus]|uniref:hypothetical protein n=1 Tax=Staphylococcus succinus TaxID=61015 RepID=UPI002DBFD066|nr:hypothetical protein [Staphylococcus succinus]MEB8210451.1 hypothetical protein [Staphylococcus succinus]
MGFITNENIIYYDGNEIIESGEELEVEDLFEKEFLISTIKDLIKNDSLEGDFESFNNKITNCKNFEEIEKTIKECDIKYKDTNDYKINKYRLNLNIIEKLKVMDDEEFNEITRSFHELYKKLNKNK